MVTLSYPWQDRRGALSPLKLACFVLLLLPAGWLLFRLLVLHDLGPRPVDALLHAVGEWAVRLLLVGLAVTPLRRLWAWPDLIQLRRMIGVAAFCYAAAHLTLYVVDQAFDLAKVAAEIVRRFYLTIGFAALLGLAALAATSTDGMVRRLGGKRWQALHRLVYLLVALALWHQLLQAKRGTDMAMIEIGCFLWLMAYRAVYAWGAAAIASNLRQSLAALVLAVPAAAGTAAIEAGWYACCTKLDWMRIWQANFDFGFRLAPAWWVFGMGAAVAVLAATRLHMAHRNSNQIGQSAAALRAK